MPPADRTITLEIEGLDKLHGLLGDLRVMKYWRAVLSSALGNLKDEVAKNPGPSHQPVKWASRAQQRAYFAKRHAAGLGPRYVRESDPQSSRLLAGWTTKVAMDGMSGTVGSRASYGPYVMDRDMQTEQHKATGWNTIQDVAEDEGPDIIEMLVDEIHDMVEQAKR